MAMTQEYAFERDSRGADLVAGVSMSTQTAPDGSYSKAQLQRFLTDIRFEPAWRRDAEVESAYYDNDQLEAETIRRLKEIGIPPVIVNMAAATIDSVSGLEVLTRASLRVVEETEDSHDVAQAMNVKFKEAQRLTEFNELAGDQFHEATKIGISWLEVSRNPDPFGYPYKVSLVPWREMYPDYRARAWNYEDGRFIVRAKWFDFDTLVRYFPKHADTIRHASWGGGGTEGWLDWETLNYESRPSSNLLNSADDTRRFTLEDDEWNQQYRGRIRLYEILYTVPRNVECLRLRDGRVVTLDRESPMHYEALRRGMAVHTTGTTMDWRQAYFIGPERLLDRPLETNRPHYIPMVAYRRDADGAPYGLMRRLKSVQQAINARYMRMLYDLSSRKVLIDDDAVDDMSRTAEEINRVNSMVVLRADRRNPDGLKIAPAVDTTQIAYQFLQEAKTNIYEVTGLRPEFLGATMDSGRSGVAIERLVEQTHQVLGRIEQNRRSAKAASGRQLLAYMLSDMGLLNDVPVETDTRSDGKVKHIILNARGADGSRSNDILMARMRVALAPAPDSVTYQQEKFRSLTEVVKSLPPEMQPMFIDLIIRAAGLPDSEEMLERVRSATGYGPEPKDPEERAALREQAEAQAQKQEMVEQLQFAVQQAELQLTQARAALETAKANKLADADTDLTEAKTLVEIAKAENVGVEAERLDRETRAKAIEASARLKTAAQPPRPAAGASKT